jgi:type VI secretion system lysozyme-like protein
MPFLFERLASVTCALTGRAEAFDLATAVAAQVQRIVAARPRVGERDAELLGFGMPHVVDLASNSRTQLDRYAAQLGRLIARYEPRLREPEVDIVPSGEALRPYRLVVSGILEGDRDPRSFDIELPAH